MITQQNISLDTPMGANVVQGGATFRVWGPDATAVYLNGRVGGLDYWSRDANAAFLLTKDANGYWAGFWPGASEGDVYKYYVVGRGSSGYKRDPYARELTLTPPFPNCNCIIRDPSLYPWHDGAFVTPDFTNMIVYQAHVGTFYSRTAGAQGTFLDAIEKIEYLAALGINVLQMLPVDEFETATGLGYNGSDIFSPDSSYGVTDPARLTTYLATVNRLLTAKGHAALTAAQLTPIPNQLKALVDLCHLYGIAVVFDVVYNHAGGFYGDDEALYFWDRNSGDNNASLYFTSAGWAGGLGFALWKREVRQFLIDNAKFQQEEFHIDGFRYDEISALVELNHSDDHGWNFCKALTDTVRYSRNRNLQNAEFWSVNPDVVKPAAFGGAGFDVTQHDGLRTTIRSAISSASGGSSNTVDMGAIAGALYPTGFQESWQAVTCVENHDEVYRDRGQRIPKIADGSNTRSWYARSRARVAMGVILSAPGIPQLFMGQEFLEDKQWHDDPKAGNRIYWDGLNSGDKSMVDFLRFTQEMIRVRWDNPALRSGSVRVTHVHNIDRVLIFHRWIEGAGADVIVVVSLNDDTFYNFSIGFPRPGRWREIMNSDVYDNWVNPSVSGNGGGVDAYGGPLHGFAQSANIVIPANSILVFAP